MAERLLEHAVTIEIQDPEEALVNYADIGMTRTSPVANDWYVSGTREPVGIVSINAGSVRTVVVGIQPELSSGRTEPASSSMTGATPITNDTDVASLTSIRRQEEVLTIARVGRDRSQTITVAVEVECRREAGITR